MGRNSATPRYAWLEHAEGMWHFLTDLFADPRESTRSWPDSVGALEELRKEGWTVIAPYPDSIPEACGYGLGGTSCLESETSERVFRVSLFPAPACRQVLQ